MKKDDMPIYSGPAYHCAQCNKEFHQEEIIYFDKSSGLVFCYSKQLINCVALYVYMKGKPIKVETRIFRISKENQKPWHIDNFKRLMNKLHGFEKHEDTDTLP